MKHLFDKFKALGISFVGCDDTKHPIGRWAHLQKSLPGPKDYKKWLNGYDFTVDQGTPDEKRIQADPATKIALICGKVSGGLELLDFDLKHHTDGENFFHDVALPGIADIVGTPNNLVIESTPSGGYHIWYRTDEVGGNKKVATQQGNTEAFIETRGEGGYGLCAPSDGYVIISGDFDKLQHLDVDKRDELLSYLGSFTEEMKVEKTKADRSVIHYKDTPWEAYDQTDEFEEVLTTHGWEKTGKEDKQRGNEFWKRPGSDNPWAASWNTHRRLFYVYSSASAFEQDKAYSPSSIRAILDYGGDFAANSRALLQEGYGKKWTDTEKKNISLIADMLVFDASVEQIFNQIGVDLADPSKKKLKDAAIYLKEEDEKIDASQNKELKKLKKVQNFLKDEMIRFNEITKYAEYPSGDRIVERDVNTFWQDLIEQNVKSSPKYILDVITSKTIEAYNPLQDYFNKIEIDWKHKEQNEGTKILSEFLSQFQFETEDENEIRVLKKFIVKWLLQIPATVYGGSVPELSLVLIANNGFEGKTGFFRNLLPEKIQYQYYGENDLTNGKDSELMMTQYLIINDDEWNGLARKDINLYKNYSSKDKFSLRSPYGRTNENFNRLSVLGGTSNSTDIIVDKTPNRRIIPVEIKSRDYGISDSIDREKLFGYLINFWKKSRESHKMTTEDVRVLQDLSMRYSQMDFEHDMLFKYVKISEDLNPEMKSASEIADHIQAMCNLRIDPIRLGRLVSSEFGMKSKQFRTESGKVSRGYPVQFIDKHQEFSLPESYFEN